MTNINSFTFYSVGIDFSLDVRFWRLKSIPTLYGLTGISVWGKTLDIKPAEDNIFWALTLMFTYTIKNINYLENDMDLFFVWKPHSFSHMVEVILENLTKCRLLLFENDMFYAWASSADFSESIRW